MQTPEYPRWKGLSRNGVSEQIALSNFSFSGPGVAEVIVKIEMRAWLSRLDAKGVDTLVVMDSCFGGGMRGVDPRSGELLVREVKGSADAAEREKFTGIPMTDKESACRRRDDAACDVPRRGDGEFRCSGNAWPRPLGSEGSAQLFRRSRTGRKRVGGQCGHAQELVPVCPAESARGGQSSDNLSIFSPRARRRTSSKTGHRFGSENTPTSDASAAQNGAIAMLFVWRSSTETRTHGRRSKRVTRL